MQGFKDKYGVIYPISKIDHIMPPRRQRGSDEQLAAKVFLVDGDEYGIEIDDQQFERLTKKMSRTLPANPGFRVLIFHPDSEGDWVSESEIIGWREDDFGEYDPIVCDESLSDVTGANAAILEPSGMVKMPYVADYESREAWEEEMRRSAADERERKAQG